MPLSFVAIGTGDRGNLTFRAHESLTRADRIYLMAGPKSWMLTFVREIAGEEKIRRYMPASVAWASWQNDPIFVEIADELAALEREGRDVVVVVAGDVAIYSNVVPLIPLLRERGLSWSVVPGVSFLNAITAETGEPLVGEGENLFVLGSRDARDLETALTAADTVVVYNPAGIEDLTHQAKSERIASAHAVMVGVGGKSGSLTDIKASDTIDTRGLVLLRRTPPAVTATTLPSHIGLNGWDSRGRLVAIGYPDRVLLAEDGKPSSLKPVHQFPDAPRDARGFFIDSHGALFASMKGFSKPPFGRTYVSRDGGGNFALALPRCCWGFDEAPGGDLFAGAYHERGESEVACELFWSSDAGSSWCDIAPPEWSAQTHVHHLAIDPARGWLYATLGDEPKLRGVWRSRAVRLTLKDAASAGAPLLRVASAESVAVGSRLVIPGASRQIVTVAEVSGPELRLTTPLTDSVAGGSRLYLLDWTKVCDRADDPLQFAGIAFHDGHIYVADDNGTRRNPNRVAVWSFRDDGTDAAVAPQPALIPPAGAGWGVFFLECTQSARLWAGIRPVQGQGQVWFSDNGNDWTLAMTAEEEDLPLWRGTHTFRDATLGQTGDGRFLSAPDGGIVSGSLNRSVVVAGRGSPLPTINARDKTTPA